MRKLLLAFLLILPTIVFAQGTATSIRYGSSLPTACGKVGSIDYGSLFYKTTSPIGHYECSVAGNPGSWRQIYSTSTSACGSAGYVQFYDTGTLGCDSQFTWDASTHTLRLGNGTDPGVITLLGTTGSPSSPAADSCAIKFNLTSGKVEFVDHSGGDCGPGSGTAGTVTHTGSLTSTQPVCGNGSDDITSCNLSGDATTSGSAVVTVAKVNGVSYPTSPSTDSVPVITASNTATNKVIPDCTDSGGNHINYTQSTHAFSCGTSSSGGGGGTVPDSVSNSVDLTPGSPNAFDDEFTGTSLSGSWTIVNQNSATITVSNSRLSVLRTGTGGDSAIAIVKAMPATPYTLTAKCSVAGIGANYLTGGLVIRDSASGKLQGFGPTWNVGNPTQGGIGALQFSVPTTSTGWLFGSTMLTYPSGPVDQYLRITDNGTNFTFQISADGISFVTLNTSSRTSYLASPNQLGVFLNNNRSSGSPNDAVLSCDYIRVQ